MARFPSGQRGRTVNPLAFAFEGSNPSLATKLCQDYKIEKYAGIAQLARATAFQAVGCGFESRFPLHSFFTARESELCLHIICLPSFFASGNGK